MITSFDADELNMIAVPALAEPTRLMVSIRYHQTPQPAVVTQLSDTEVRIDLDSPQRGIAPGQAVVFYDGNDVIGGATIRRTDLM